MSTTKPIPPTRAEFVGLQDELRELQMGFSKLGEDFNELLASLDSLRREVVSLPRRPVPYAVAAEGLILERVAWERAA